MTDAGGSLELHGQPRVVSVAASTLGVPPQLGKLVVQDLAARSTLTVVQVPLLEAGAFIRSLSEAWLSHLSAARLLVLTQRLLSLFEFEFSPTACPEIPIRANLLLERICHQPPLFLPHLLRQVSEWFGIHPDAALLLAWSELTTQKRDDVQLPEPLNAYRERGLTAVVGADVLIPVPALAAWRVASASPDWETLPDLLHKARQALLDKGAAESRDTFYERVASHMLKADPSLDGHAYATVRARGLLVDLHKVAWDQPVSEPVVDAIVVALQALFDTEPQQYKQAFNRVHGPLWRAIDHAMRTVPLSRGDESRRIVVDSSDWAGSCRVVSQALRHVSEAYASLTRLEEALGVDRYLGSQVIAPDLARVHGMVRRTGDQTQRSLEDARHVFLRKWNIAQIAPVVLGLLGLRCGKPSIAHYFPADQQHVVFVLVDGLGYTQFHWFLQTVARQPARLLTGNIFAWLRDCGAYNDSYLLASNLVGVTGGCLPTIYTGALPWETGIVGSHVLMDGHVLDVLHGRQLPHHGPKVSRRAINDIYQRNTNQGLSPMPGVARRRGVDVRIVHGGKAGFVPLTRYTYGSLANVPNRIRFVSPADRVFSVAASCLEHWSSTPHKKGLALIYYPLIDSSGHPSGPYTQFQAAELAKLNFLFTHFLLELLGRYPSFFDGNTSIVLSSDHGMFESSSQVVSERMIRQALKGKLAEDAVLIYDNRACYIYGAPYRELGALRGALEEFFKAERLPIAVSTKDDPPVRELLCGPEALQAMSCPDIILQFSGPGVFYDKEKLPSHMFLFGAHGGCSVDETFVPLVHFRLTTELAHALRRHYR